MRVLVDPSTFDYQNMGDLAMLKVAIGRLRALWPAAQIEMFTDDAETLQVHFPDVAPISQTERRHWSGEHYLLGRLHTYLPRNASRMLLQQQSVLRRTWPALEELLLSLRMRLGGYSSDEFRRCVGAVKNCDLLVVSGAASLTDSMPVHARMVLNTLERAAGRKKPVAMLSQGIGPLNVPELVSKARQSLAGAKLIALRESRAGVPLLKSLGVPVSRMVTTGDDAIEIAYRARKASLGNDIGVNIRLASYSQVDHEMVEPLRTVLQSFARKQNAALIPIPIALHAKAHDPESIRGLLRGYDDHSDGGSNLNTPLKVIEQVGRCRIVVTGAYHAAVFALAQGIPVVGLAKSPYVREKFLGLADQFGAGCETVDLNLPNFSEKLEDAMQKAWLSAPSVRPQLLKAAALQIELSCAAYKRVSQLLPSRAVA